MTNIQYSITYIVLQKICLIKRFIYYDKYIIFYNIYNITKNGGNKKMQTGFFRVDIDNNKLSNGFFAVRYRCSIDGEKISISKTSLNELEKTILENNLPWKVTNQEKAAKTRAFDNDFQKAKKQRKHIFDNEYKKEVQKIRNEYYDKISQVSQKYQDEDYQQRMALIRNFVNDMNDVNFYKK